MLTRRFFAGCALCTAIGLVPTGAGAQAPQATRRILQSTELAGTNFVSHLVLVEIPAGATVAPHTHPGIESSYVLEGEIELTVQGQPARQIRAGGGFQVPVGIVHGGKAGPAPVRIAATFTVEKDKPLASPAPG